MNEKFLTPVQVRELVKVSEPNIKHQCQILLMAHAGLRVSEVTNLKLSDINFKNRTIKVKSLKARKTEKIRVIPLSDQLYEALVTYIAKSKRKIGTDDLIFVGANGSKMNRGSINKMLKKYEFSSPELAGVQIYPHKLRHTFATLVRASGGSLMDIQNALGHSRHDTSMIYAHATPEEMRSLVNKSMPKKSFWKRIFGKVTRRRLPHINVAIDGNFLVGNTKELERVNEALRKNINVIIAGDIGTGKSHLLDFVTTDKEVLRFDDTKGFKKQIENSILHLLNGDKEKAIKLVFGTDDQEKLTTKISKNSLINLCKALKSIVGKYEFILRIDDMEGVTPSVVKALQILNGHFVILTTAKNIAIKNTSFLWNFERVELKNLNRENSLRMIYRLTAHLHAQDYSHLKNRVWESSNGNPRMIFELCERLSKEKVLDRHTVSEICANYIGKELKQIDMSIYFLLLFGGLAVLRYLATEVENPSFRFIGGCFMIVILFARYFFNSFRRKSF